MRKLVTVSLVFIVCALVSMTAVYADEAPKTKLEELALPLVGTPYKYGGSSTSGFDCSGFSSYIFGKLGIELSRSSSSQALQGTPVKKSDLRAGDLVFFKTNGYSISHVGIYLGNNKMIHSSTNNGVEIRSINEQYYVNRYVTARRVLTQEQYEKWAALSKQEQKQESKQESVKTNEAQKVAAEDQAAQQAEKEQQEKEQQSEERDTARMLQNQKMKEIFLMSVDQLTEK